ncbi:hypothetical protein ACFWJY_04760 [Streptomyces anulatus]|uniref:hypothetical protein n=1 Tax=Streptomyces anulatus TaxID=1892 RepID=UPI00364F104E
MKKFVAAAGVALGGVALVISAQGSAQASAPAAQVSAQTSAQQTDDVRPQALGGLVKAAGKAAGKAYVHAKAACPSVANAAGVVGGYFAGGSVAPADKIGNAEAIDTVFDK